MKCCYKIPRKNKIFSTVGKNLATKLSPTISNDSQEQNSSNFTQIYQITPTVCEINVDDSKFEKAFKSTVREGQCSRWYFLNGPGKSWKIAIKYPVPTKKKPRTAAQITDLFPYLLYLARFIESYQARFLRGTYVPQFVTILNPIIF